MRSDTAGAHRPARARHRPARVQLAGLLVGCCLAMVACGSVPTAAPPGPDPATPSGRASVAPISPSPVSTPSPPPRPRRPPCPRIAATVVDRRAVGHADRPGHPGGGPVRRAGRARSVFAIGSDS